MVAIYEVIRRKAGNQRPHVIASYNSLALGSELAANEAAQSAVRKFRNTNIHNF